MSMNPPTLTPDQTAKGYEIDEEGVVVDRFGNPIDGDRLIYCCFPYCGCDGARLCMAENGASVASLWLNHENMWEKPKERKP
jgi:hypothetical protein